MWTKGKPFESVDATQNRKFLIPDFLAPTEVEFTQTGQCGEKLDPAATDLTAIPEVEPFEVDEFPEKSEACIGDRVALVQVESLEPFETGEVGQTRIGDPGGVQTEVFQIRESLQVR